METVKIGWGRRDISYHGAISVAGQMYLRISEGVLDPLYVTALCVDGGEGMDKVIFLSADVATVYPDTLEPIFRAVAAKNPQIPTDAIIFNATHTHTGPEIDNPDNCSPDGVSFLSGTEYKNFFVEKCAEAVCEAWENRTAGGIGYGYGYAVVAHSRRVVYFEEKEKLAKRNFTTPAGYAVMYGNTNNALFSHYEAGADHFLNLMFTFDPEQKLTGIVVNVPCPSQVGGGLCVLSADYWHDVRQLVEQEFGSDVFVLPQCAAAGDLAPDIPHYKNAQNRRFRLKYGADYDRPGLGRDANPDYYDRVRAGRKDIAERIMNGIREVYSWAKKDILTQLPVRHEKKIMALLRRQITDEERQWCEENLEMLAQQVPQPEGMTPEEYREAITRHASAVRRNKGGIERCEDVKKHPTMDMAAHLVQIGDIAFATIRFELFQDFMHRLQARSPFLQTFVVQLCGDEGGNYLATKRGVKAKGYSASMFCNRVSADGGQQWVEESLNVLQQFKAQDEA